MITISRDRRVHGNVLPEPVCLLGALPESVQHHTLYNLRPAAAIYNVSLPPVFRAFKRVLSEIDRYQAEGTLVDGHVHFDTAQLLAAQADLLAKMAAHIDECYLVLKALQPPVSIKDPHSFTDRWLQQANHPTIANFKRRFENYYRHLSAMVNLIKHRQARLSSVLFAWNGGTRRLPGYFLVGIDSKGAVGPDPQIHPKGGAISFARDVRVHFSAVYLIGNSLSDAVRKAIMKVQKVKIKPIVVNTESDGDAFEVARHIGRLPELVFPDERVDDVPLVRVFENSSTRQILLAERPGKPFGFPPGGAAVTSNAEGDGHSKTFRFPYLSPKQFRST